MENTLELSLEKNNEVTLTEESKNIFEGISDAFQNAIKKGTELIQIPENYKEIIKNGLQKIDAKEIAITAGEMALRTGMKNLGMKVSTFDSIKGVVEAVKEGDLKKGLSKGIDLAVSVLKIPTTAKTLIKTGKDAILGNIFEDELKKVMQKQQNTISRIDKKCTEIEKAFETNDSKTIDRVSKTLKTDLEKVMPIERVITRGHQILNQCELYKNKNKIALTSDEIEICKKLSCA